LTRQPIGPVRGDSDTRALLKSVMEEAASVGRTQGIDFDNDLIAERMAFIDKLPADMTSSMQRDLERGNRLELDWLSGAVARMGRESGVGTPANAFIYTALKLSAAGKKT
jgi:2-dehydropantoate 2-reductase